MRGWSLRNCQEPDIAGLKGYDEEYGFSVVITRHVTQQIMAWQNGKWVVPSEKSRTGSAYWQCRNTEMRHDILEVEELRQTQRNEWVLQINQSQRKRTIQLVKYSEWYRIVIVPGHLSLFPYSWFYPKEESVKIVNEYLQLYPVLYNCQK